MNKSRSLQCHKARDGGMGCPAEAGTVKEGPNASSNMPMSTIKKQLHKLKKKLNADPHIKIQVPTHELHFPIYSISIFHQFSSVYLILSFS